MAFNLRKFLGIGEPGLGQLGQFFTSHALKPKLSGEDRFSEGLKKLQKLGKDILRVTPRALGTLELSRRGLRELRPETKLQKFLFGEEPVYSFGKRKEMSTESWMRRFHLRRSTAEKIAPISLALGLGLEALPVGPTKGKLIKEAKPVLTAIERVTEALRLAKPVRRAQEALYTIERAKRFRVAKKIGERIGGERGFFAELSQLRGKMPRVQFETIRNKISQKDIDVLFETINKSPELTYPETLSARKGLAKLFGEFGGAVPTRGELDLLERVFPKEFIKEVSAKRSLWEKAKEAGLQLANIPRSVMASFDLSAPLRQGAFLIGHPKRFTEAFLNMFRAFGSERAFKATQEAIKNKQTFGLMKKGRLALTEMKGAMSRREEPFMSSWAEKIPGAGRIIRASGRAYSAFLNKLRADVFEDLILKAERVGLEPNKDIQLVKEIAGLVNVASGRGSLGGLERAAVALNSFFFSPRLMASRLTLLNPFYYIRAHPFVRKEAIRSLFAFGGAVGTTLALAKMGGASVETDPRNADFLKIRIGKTRIDIAAGFQQYIRFAAQLATGQYISSTTGKLVTLGEGYRALSRKDILLRQVETKEAPVFSFITSLLEGKTFTGEEVSIPKEIGKRFVPMAMQDIYEVAKEDPDLIPIAALGIFGVGIQTYGEGAPLTEEEKQRIYELSIRLSEQAKDREGLRKEAEELDKELLKLPKSEANARVSGLKQTNPPLYRALKDVVLSRKLGLTPEEKMIKQLGVENGARAKYIHEQALKLPTRNERNAYVANLKRKGLVSETVAAQLRSLIAKDRSQL